jgi:hypothetical protein
MVLKLIKLVFFNKNERQWNQVSNAKFQAIWQLLAIWNHTLMMETEWIFETFDSYSIIETADSSRKLYKYVES